MSLLQNYWLSFVAWLFIISDATWLHPEGKFMRQRTQEQYARAHTHAQRTNLNGQTRSTINLWTRTSNGVQKIFTLHIKRVLKFKGFILYFPSISCSKLYSTHSTLAFAGSYFSDLQIHGVVPRIKLHHSDPVMDRTIKNVRRLEQAFVPCCVM
jgi:hypothetical protein